MQFSKFVLIFSSVYGITASAIALPEAFSTAASSTPSLTAPNPGHIELGREQTEGGEVVYYGPPEQSKAVSKDLSGPERRDYCAASPSWSCDGDTNLARNDICNRLIYGLLSQVNEPVLETSRTACLWGDGIDPKEKAVCCIGWNKSIPGLTKDQLYDLSNQLYHRCDYTRGVSGEVKNVVLGGQCVAFCLSNGGDDCN